MVKILDILGKRWKQYKYRFVPWIAFNLRKRKLRTVEGSSNDKIIPDSKVEHSLLVFFSGLYKESQGPMHGPEICTGQRSRGQKNSCVENGRHAVPVEIPKWFRSSGRDWCQTPQKAECRSRTPTSCKQQCEEWNITKRNWHQTQNKKGCHMSGHSTETEEMFGEWNTSQYWPQNPKWIGCHISGLTPTKRILHKLEERKPVTEKPTMSIVFKFSQILNRRFYVELNTHSLYCLLKSLCSDIFASQVPKEKLENYLCKELYNWNCKPAIRSPTENTILTLKPTIRCTSYRNFTAASSDKETGQIQTGEGSRLSSDGLEVMHRILGFTIERRPSSIAGGGTGVFVTRGVIPAETVVAMYPGTVYKSWEPILLQSLANPFIFRCLDGTLIDGNDKGLSRMIYRSCAQRDRIGPYLTSDPSWLTTSLTNPMAVGQYVNNQNRDNEANVAYQEFDVPELFPLHLLQYIPNVFYSSTYQQNDSSSERVMQTVVLVSLREIRCGEELFSSYFTIVH